jgi:hypothetical protein
MLDNEVEPTQDIDVLDTLFDMIYSQEAKHLGMQDHKAFRWEGVSVPTTYCLQRNSGNQEEL